MANISPLQAFQFVATRSEEEIARRLRHDEALIHEGKTCSWVAWHLPDYGSTQGAAVAKHLAPISGLSHSIRGIIYENLLSKIRRYLKDGRSNRTPNGAVREMVEAQESLLPSEILTALKVIKHLQKNAIIQRDTPVESIVSWLQERVLPPPPSFSANNYPDAPNIPKPPPVPRKRLCYICRLVITNPYPSHPSMCMPCGAFNHSSSLLSTPSRLTLPPTFTALVTGARVNLGYHTALRLLRCGARVVATTRYPRDAVVRYLEEPDSAEWKERLRVIGADFRSAKDAHDLLHETKQCLRTWAEAGEARLSLLVNNAAQTLTDSIKKEERAIKREGALREQIKGQKLLILGSYQARVRGSAMPMCLQGAKDEAIPFESPGTPIESTETKQSLHGTPNSPTTELEPYTKSSWVQSLSEIPYEDLITAHSVNTFVPFILCRELLPLMGYPPATSTPSPSPPQRSSTTTTSKPAGYIINVSSREGIFESRLSSSAKRGKHVHTNMSKAALNMLTETEAETAWHSRRVAMNTVDPGYMSAAPEYQDAFGGVRPIGWEDGAGRVLWPVALGEGESVVVKGRFLKHYGAVEVDPGVGRG